MVLCCIVMHFLRPFFDMGCGGSKADDLPLVVRCRERRELIRAANNHRCALAAAHVSYFRSLKDVGDALRKFVDEDLISISVTSSSLPLPESNNAGESLHLHNDGESHLHLSDSSPDDDDRDSEGDYTHRHHDGHHSHDSDRDGGTHQHQSHRVHINKGKGFDPGVNNFHNFAESSSNYSDGGFDEYVYDQKKDLSMLGEPSSNPQDIQEMRPPLQSMYYSNHLKKSAPAMKTVVQEKAAQSAYQYLDSYWNSAADYGYSEVYKVSPQQQTPPLPSPMASAWDFLNPFDVYDGGYEGHYSTRNYGNGSNSSSPDSSEVRKKEGIPDLEEETENEVYKEVREGKSMNVEAKRSSGDSTPVSRAVPLPRSPANRSRSVLRHKSKNSSRSVLSNEESEKPSMPMQYNGKRLKRLIIQQNSEGVKPSMSLAHSKGKTWIEQSENMDVAGSISLADAMSSPETLISKSVDGVSVKKKGLNSEVEWTSKENAGSSNISVTKLSPHGTRDLPEVVAEIRDDFEIASSYGKEVAMMLEAGRMPYQPSFVKVILSRILHLIAPSLMSSYSSSIQTVKLASRSVKLAKSYFEDVGKDSNAKVGSLSSTLDKLYAWEKKLYKEVKDEERLRITYEKQCKRLRILDEAGAESGKIYAVEASTRRLLTRLDVCIKAIHAISCRIHKLRDEELQPKVAALIYGLIRMWNALLNCHKKQFQAIMETNLRKFKVTTNRRTDASSMAIIKLEKELRSWCHHFKDWIGFQKSYAESLNGWLLQCLQYEPEEALDGPALYSPLQLGAPPIFIICYDWYRAMETISKGKVTNAMNAFAASLRKLWEKQDEEERQRIKAEYLLKNYEKQLGSSNRVERGKKEREQDVLSDKSELLIIVPSDDVMLHLNSLKKRLTEERMKHKDAIKSARDAASRSLHGGLIPIFKALENFASEALEAHQHVRLQEKSSCSQINNNSRIQEA